METHEDDSRATTGRSDRILLQAAAAGALTRESGSALTLMSSSTGSNQPSSRTAAGADLPKGASALSINSAGASGSGSGSGSMEHSLHDTSGDVSLSNSPLADQGHVRQASDRMEQAAEHLLMSATRAALWGRAPGVLDAVKPVDQLVYHAPQQPEPEVMQTSSGHGAFSDSQAGIVIDPSTLDIIHVARNAGGATALPSSSSLFLQASSSSGSLTSAPRDRSSLFIPRGSPSSTLSDEPEQEAGISRVSTAHAAALLSPRSGQATRRPAVASAGTANLPAEMIAAPVQQDGFARKRPPHETPPPAVPPKPSFSCMTLASYSLASQARSPPPKPPRRSSVENVSHISAGTLSRSTSDGRDAAPDSVLSSAVGTHAQIAASDSVLAFERHTELSVRRLSLDRVW